MADETDYGACLAGSAHVLALVGMMHQDSVDCVVTSSETESGLPFVSITCQGMFSQQVEVVGRNVADAIAAEREESRREAEEN